MRNRQIKWTPQMDDRLRELYPTTINDNIAKDLGLIKHQVEHRAHRLGLKKPEGFKREHMAESMAKRRTDTIACRNNPGRFREGHTKGIEYRFREGHHFPPEKEKERIEHVTKARGKQTYDELVRIKYGLRRKTKMAMPEKVFYINKEKYIDNED